jgi:hypothetical protein
VPDLKESIKAKAAELGFVACGFARADAAPEAGERLREWIAAGYHGEMGWIEERAEQRASPQGLWPDVRSVIALAMSYAPASDPMALAGEGSRGRISVYAQGTDYHKTVKKALKAMGRWLADGAGCQLKVFVDTAPVMEKPLSAAAGTTIIVSTHVIAHAERLCERVAIIAEGKVAFEGRVDEARGRLRPIVHLRTRADDGPWRAALPSSAQHIAGEWRFELPEGGPEPLLKALIDGGAGIETLSIERPGLHDAFIAIAGAAAARDMGQPNLEQAA